MSDKELFRRMKQAQVKEWKIEINRLKIKASWLKDDMQLGMNKQIRLLESKIKEANASISLLAETKGDAWESIKNFAESAYNSLKFPIGDSSAKFNK